MTPSNRTRTLIVGVLLGILPTLLSAQAEIARKRYVEPLGLTEADGLRVVIAPAPIRMPQGSSKLCAAEATVEILDALDTTIILATFGPRPVGVGESFQADFSPSPGPRPSRQEVLVSVVIERRPFRKVERGSLDDLCPIVGSVQAYDLSTGRTLHTADLSHIKFANNIHSSGGYAPTSR